MYIVDENSRRDTYDWVANIVGNDTLVTLVRPKRLAKKYSWFTKRYIYNERDYKLNDNYTIISIICGDVKYSYIYHNGKHYDNIEDFLSTKPKVRLYESWLRDTFIHKQTVKNDSGLPVYYTTNNEKIDVYVSDTPLASKNQQEIWDNIYNYLLRLKNDEEIERNSKITDKEKILSKGFDTKKSFRNMPR